jgi:hypothetical protein
MQQQTNKHNKAYNLYSTTIFKYLHRIHSYISKEKYESVM